MAAIDFLIDATTRNAVFVQRLAGGQYRETLERLNQLERDIIGIIGSTPEQQAARTTALLQVQRTASEAFQEIARDINLSATETAEYMAGFTQRLMNRASTEAFGLPENFDEDVLNAVLNIESGVTPLTIQSATEQYGAVKAAEVNRIISDAFIVGATNQEVIDAVQQTLRIQKQQAESLVRTSTNSAAQTGRLATFAANADLLEGYEIVAALDSRTTLICAGLDGEIRPIEDAFIPPFHWGCRTQIVAALLPQFQRDDLDGERRTSEGEITADTTYGDWLARQPASFQDEALGPTRAALFRRGDLPIDRFTDDNLNVYTLDQLRELEPLAFERAGLDN